MKKIISLMLVIIMIFAVLASCDGASDADTTSIDDTTSEEITTTEDTSESISDLTSDITTDTDEEVITTDTESDTESTDTESTDTESTDTESTDTESTDTESTDTESTDTEAPETPKTKGITINGNPLEQYVIVYCDSFYGRQAANYVKAAILEKTGIELTATTDAAAEVANEILVGKTNRQASKDIRSTFSWPNVHYDISAVESKLVIMGEGYRTLNSVRYLFKTYLNELTDNSNITGNIKNGQVKVKFDADKNMLPRATGTELRVFHWNMMAPYASQENAVYTNWQQRIEIMVDTILAYNPDIITTNEMYAKNYSDKQYQLLKKELSHLFNVIDNSPYDKGKPYADSDVVEGLTVNEQIFIRKNISVITSGWRYLSEKDANGAPITYHGIHWAVLEKNNKQFILSVAHYGDARTNATFAIDHLNAIKDAQAASGSSTTLPTILTGDMYTFINHSGGAYGSGYYHLQSNGYKDSQVTAQINANNNTLHGTFHDIGVKETERASEDFVWYNDGFEALKFKVLVDDEITNSSDHYPVCADLKFK